MKYDNIREAEFISRPNRFVAEVLLDGEAETVHVKNTGRCRELLIPGSRVSLFESANPMRKTRYDLVSVYKKGLGWVNIDSQAPNAAMLEWLESSPSFFGEIDAIHPEYARGGSRVDFMLRPKSGGRKILIEVKGCTLEIGGIGYFPDAPTERGVKHLRELADATGEGFECYIAFVIALPKVVKVLPNIETHREFGRALCDALDAGVRALCLPCEVTPDSLRIIGVSEALRTDLFPEPHMPQS